RVLNLRMHEVIEHLESVADASFGDARSGPEAMVLVSLIHTETEHELYKLMLAETRKRGAKSGKYSVSRLMIESGIHNHSKVKRGRAGLLDKMSIERQTGGWDAETGSSSYTVYEPDEILARRYEAGLDSPEH